MLPSILARQLKVALSDYVETTFPMTDPAFRGALRRMLDQPGALFHDPYLNVRLPFRVAESVDTVFKAVHTDYKPYVHQLKAWERLLGNDGRSTLVATGTGSGKTECFLYPILEYCYAHRGEPGIKALIIYPMNALAADQAKRIAEEIYKSEDKLRGNVTAGIYVGGRQENPSKAMTKDQIITDHETMLASPPDILLTNYKMLDYLLVRPKDAQLWRENGPETLKYIVVDELHTFDGAQGTDLAGLLRRLKSRLHIQTGYLCCVGTSATMGGPGSAESIRQYAEKIFGEYFEPDSVITEDRISVAEFFADHHVSDYTFPTPEQVAALAEHVNHEDKRGFLTLAAQSWLKEPFDQERLFSDQGRVDLANALMEHSFLRDLLQVIKGDFVQTRDIIEALTERYVQLVEMDDPAMAIDSFVALISHARTMDIKGKLRPFLHVQVQLWLRELRRLLASVSPDDIVFALESDLNEEQSKYYLPVVNCRECGETGWASLRTEETGVLSVGDLRQFYNLYFKADPRVVMVFSRHDGAVRRWNPARHDIRLCPKCLKLHADNGEGHRCSCRGVPTMAVWMPTHLETTGPKNNKRYICPSCGSEAGISIMGVQAVTAISALLSQLYSSHYNDDKKLLAFSDNVQDAAHRAGFFNSRTWTFSMRTAIQQFALDRGAGLSLSEFAPAFVSYWQSKLTPEEFVSTFIPADLTWMRAFEEMKETGALPENRDAEILLDYLSNRLQYQVYLEFGLESRLGRTLEKSGASVLALNRPALQALKVRLLERLRNEVGELRGLSDTILERILAGWLYHLRTNGAFGLDVYTRYIASGGNIYHLTSDWVRWLPGIRRVPRFLIAQRTERSRFDVPAQASWYGRWLEKHVDLGTLIRPEFFLDTAKVIIEELRDHKVLLQLAGPRQIPVWALSPGAMKVSTNVSQMVCEKCRTVISIAKEDLDLWQDSYCVRPGCNGRLHEDTTAQLDYYGKLYSNGTLTRIIAHEHTGLLEREEREELEKEFKRKKDERRPWDPNLLSSTPTLEMGIDIGDLSTVVLCSIPPGQSQYIQRVGRAGRSEGNSLAIAVANVHPHDLYFYAEPKEMIAGGVRPPAIFLNASAVLERQFVAFCMDCWVRTGIPEQAVPKRLGSCLDKLNSRPKDFFPFNFLNYVQTNLANLYRRFIAMFEEYLTDESKEDLYKFARGDGLRETPMHVKVLKAFESVYSQRESIRKSIRQLRAMIKELEQKPKDISFQEELRELRSERNALVGVVQGINGKDVFNFLSDGGLLPNYAFPESGVVLKAVLYRKGNEGEQRKRRYERVPYEYHRPASAAISEFAPANSFYVGGRKLSIDQIDISTTQSALWRLCPNCSYAQLEEAGRSVASCPRCGSVEWADSGQVRPMLRVQMVYSEMDYTKSLIGEEERRSTVFYLKQLLVDVEERDIERAYKVGNEDFPFGYEYVRKAKLREINFGEMDIVGERLTVAGVEEVRKGFVICRYCGKVQTPGEPPKHTMTCRARKQLPGNEEPMEECLFLYREFETEALRILIPSTTVDWSKARQESFVAGFMLGLRGYFGNVDHLNYTVTEVPVPDSAYRKQYLVVYDTVPGGTGYLKQLMHAKYGLVQVLEKAISIMETCTCNQDEHRDGCYRCLYAYRQSQHIGQISKREALELLRKIAAGKEHIEEVQTIGSIPVNTLLESDLERQFIGAFELLSTGDLPICISKAVINNKEGYHLRVGNCLWAIEPQVQMDQSLGVQEVSRADFVLTPLRATQKQKPVAIFTDGFQFHKETVNRDTLQRLAISQTGRFRVWTLTWRDVQHVFRSQGDYCPPVLKPEEMPSGPRIYGPLVRHAGAEALNPGSLNAFQLLIQYLANPDAERLFQVHAKAYAFSLMEHSETNNQQNFEEWFDLVQPIHEVFDSEGVEFTFQDTVFGKWTPPRAQGLTIAAGLSRAKYAADKENAAPLVYALFDDTLEPDRVYEASWNGFWSFVNMMQFLPGFAAVTKQGVNSALYASLVASPETEESQVERPSSQWQEVYEQLFHDLAVLIASQLENQGAPPPSVVGFDLADKDGKIIGHAEMAWEEEKVAWLLPDQEVFQELFEEHGWQVYVGDEVPSFAALRKEA